MAELTELSTSFGDELAELQKEFHQLVRMPPDGFPALVLRFAFSRPASVRSRRSPGRICLLER
jgi:hypothetical protein